MSGMPSSYLFSLYRKAAGGQFFFSFSFRAARVRDVSFYDLCRWKMFLFFLTLPSSEVEEKPLPPSSLLAMTLRRDFLFDLIGGQTLPALSPLFFSSIQQFPVSSLFLHSRSCGGWSALR